MCVSRVRCVCEASPQVGHEVSSAAGGRRPEDLTHKQTVMSSQVQTLIRTEDIVCFMFNIYQTVCLTFEQSLTLSPLPLLLFTLHTNRHTPTFTQLMETIC